CPSMYLSLPPTEAVIMNGPNPSTIAFAWVLVLTSWTTGRSAVEGTMTSLYSEFLVPGWIQMESPMATAVRLPFTIRFRAGGTSLASVNMEVHCPDQHSS